MSNIHPSWVKIGGVALEIMEGKHDDDLESIANACKTRLKMRFRKGQKVKLTGTSNVEFEGKVGTVEKVNAKTVTVGLGTFDREWDVWSEGSLNVPPRMLEAV